MGVAEVRREWVGLGVGPEKKVDGGEEEVEKGKLVVGLKKLIYKEA